MLACVSKISNLLKGDRKIIARLSVGCSPPRDGTGATRVDGRMVDAPVLRKAQSILELARRSNSQEVP
jgi:citrate lyase beta subunit